MGMDIHGNNGNYFGADCWSWRPMIMLCNYAIETGNLEIKLRGGLDNQDDCDLLAYALKMLVAKKVKDNFYINLGIWCTATGDILSEEDKIDLDAQYPIGSILTTMVVTKDGKLVRPAYGINRQFLDNFIEFLHKCGGFEIH